MEQGIKHEQVSREVPDAVASGVEQRKVLCFLCRKWVQAGETLIVVGNHDVRAHICTKHVEKSKS